MLTRRFLDKGAELLAVILSLAYTLLYLKGVFPWAYVPAFAGAAIFVFLCWNRKIYAESFLQLFYVAMAVYGFVSSQGNWEIIHWDITQHLPYLFLGVIGVAGTGFVLSHYTDAKNPFLDAFTTIYSLIATWLMVNFVHEQWLYWMVINSVSILLYAQRKLYFGAILFFIYLVMAVDGYFENISIF